MKYGEVGVRSAGAFFERVEKRVEKRVEPAAGTFLFVFLSSCSFSFSSSTGSERKKRRKERNRKIRINRSRALTGRYENISIYKCCGIGAERWTTCGRRLYDFLDDPLDTPPGPEEGYRASAGLVVERLTVLGKYINSFFGEFIGAVIPVRKTRQLLTLCRSSVNQSQYGITRSPI